MDNSKYLHGPKTAWLALHMDRKRQTLSCHCLPEQAGLVAVCPTRKYCSFYIIINCYWRHGCLVEMAGYWQTYFVEVFMDLNCVPVHKHAKKKEPSQYLAILMSGLVISPENLIDYYLGSSFLTQLRDFASDKKKTEWIDRWRYHKYMCSYQFWDDVSMKVFMQVS